MPPLAQWLPGLQKGLISVEKSSQGCDKSVTQLPDGVLETHRLLTWDNMFRIDHCSLSLQSAPDRTALGFMGKHCHSRNINYRRHPALHGLLIVAVSACCQPYLKSPERIRGVWVSVKEPCGLCSGTQQIFGRQTLRLRDVPYLCHKGWKMHQRIFKSQVWINCKLHHIAGGGGRRVSWLSMSKNFRMGVGSG